MIYDPRRWHWIIGGDTSRAWSSGAVAWVVEWPADQVTRIGSEAELVEVMAQAGCPGRGPAWRDAYALMIDSDAEKVRLKYITARSGMAMTYAEKRAHADKVLAMGLEAANAMTPAEYGVLFPTLAASVRLEAVTLYKCAQLVVAKAAAWGQLSYGIERARITGKAAIAAAADSSAARDAYRSIVWPG